MSKKSKGNLLKFSIILKKIKVNRKTLVLIEQDQLPMLRAAIACPCIETTHLSCSFLQLKFHHRLVQNCCTCERRARASVRVGVCVCRYSVCVCACPVYSHPSYTGHGVWRHFHKQHVDMHGTKNHTLDIQIFRVAPGNFAISSHLCIIPAQTCLGQSMGDMVRSVDATILNRCQFLIIVRDSCDSQHSQNSHTHTQIYIYIYTYFPTTL